jgi:hypothetical protein
LAASLFCGLQQLRQLRDVRRDPPRLIFGKQLGDVRCDPPRLIANKITRIAMIPA